MCRRKNINKNKWVDLKEKQQKSREKTVSCLKKYSFLSVEFRLTKKWKTLISLCKLLFCDLFIKWRLIKWQNYLFLNLQDSLDFNNTNISNKFTWFFQSLKILWFKIINFGHFQEFLLSAAHSEVAKRH